MNPVNGINVRIYFLEMKILSIDLFPFQPRSSKRRWQLRSRDGRCLGGAVELWVFPRPFRGRGSNASGNLMHRRIPRVWKARNLSRGPEETLCKRCASLSTRLCAVLITGRGLFGLIEYDIPSSFLFLPSLPILEANEKRCTRQTHWITFLCVNLSQIVWDTYVISYRWNEDPTQAETGSPIPNLVTFSTITTTSPPNFPRNLKTGKRVNHPSLPHPRRNDLKRSGQRVFSKQDTKDIHKIKGRKSWRELKVIPTLSLSPSCTPPRESGGSCSLALLKEASLTPERGETAHRGLEREKEGGRERGWTTESLCTCDEETERPRWAFLGY